MAFQVLDNPLLGKSQADCNFRCCVSSHNARLGCSIESLNTGLRICWSISSKRFNVKDLGVRLVGSR